MTRRSQIEHCETGWTELASLVSTAQHYLSTCDALTNRATTGGAGRARFDFGQSIVALLLLFLVHALLHQIVQAILSVPEIKLIIQKPQSGIGFCQGHSLELLAEVALAAQVGEKVAHVGKLWLVLAHDAFELDVFAIGIEWCGRCSTEDHDCGGLVKVTDAVLGVAAADIPVCGQQGAEVMVQRMLHLPLLFFNECASSGGTGQEAGDVVGNAGEHQRLAHDEETSVNDPKGATKRRGQRREKGVRWRMGGSWSC